jgi:hypothetical protein
LLQKALMKRLINKMVELITEISPRCRPCGARCCGPQHKRICEEILGEVHGEPRETLSILLCSDFATDIWRARSLVVRYL